MSGLRRAAMVVAAGLLAALMSIVVTPTAHACSCVARAAEDQLAAADVVFAGDALERGDRPGEWTVRVLRTYRGDLPEKVTIATMEGTMCDLAVAAGARYLIVGREAGKRIVVPGCGGSQEIVDDVLIGGPGAAILALLGVQGSAPATSGADPRPAWPGVVMIVGGTLAVTVLVARRRVASRGPRSAG